MSLSTVAPKVFSNLRQYGHKASSYIDSTTRGAPVTGSVARSLATTRIALVSAAVAIAVCTAMSTATTTTTARIIQRRLALLVMERSLSPGTASLRVRRQIVGNGYRRCGGVPDRQKHVAGAGLVVDIPPVVPGERSRVSGQHRGVVVDGAHILLGVVVAVDRVFGIVGEPVGREITTGRHDAVVGREDVAAVAVLGECRWQELHRTVCAGGAQPDDATEPRFDRVDRREVVPADSGCGFGLAVITEQLTRGRRRVDAPRGQRVLWVAGYQRVELPARVDVAVVGVEERLRDVRAHRGVQAGLATQVAVGQLLTARRGHQHLL